MPNDSITAPRGFRSGPYNYHEEAIINISNLTNTGQGVGRDEKNWVILIPFCFLQLLHLHPHIQLPHWMVYEL